MSLGGIPFPSGPRFAIADIARIAMEDAVSKPTKTVSRVSGKYSQNAHLVQIEGRQGTSIRNPGLSLFQASVTNALTFQGRSTKVITGPIILIKNIWLCLFVVGPFSSASSSPSPSRARCFCFNLSCKLAYPRFLSDRHVQNQTCRLFLTIFHNIMEFASPTMNRKVALTEPPTHKFERTPEPELWAYR